MKKYHVTTIDSDQDIAMGYAEFIIGVNDGDYTVCNISSAVDKEALMDNYVRKHLQCGDVLLDVSMGSVIWYEVNYTSSKNTRYRGVRFICHAGGSDYTGKPIDNDTFYKLWNKAVIEFVKGVADHLGQKGAKIYFHGKQATKVTVVETLY